MKLPRYNLRTLFIVLTLFAMGCAYYSWQAKIVRDRRDWYKTHPINKEIDISDIPHFKKFSQGDPNQIPSWFRQWMGDWPRERVYVLHSTSIEDKQKAAVQFPEANILEIPRGY